jgi:hypothetical protein
MYNSLLISSLAYEEVDLGFAYITGFVINQAYSDDRKEEHRSFIDNLLLF